MSRLSQISASREQFSFREIFAARRDATDEGNPPSALSGENANAALAQPVERARPNTEASVMSGNFAGRSKEQSRYIQATLDSFGRNSLLEQAQKRQTFALVQEATALYDHGPRAHRSEYVELYKQSLKIRKMMRGKLAEAQQQAGEEALNRIKEERESRIKELLVPKDANGEALQVGPQSPSSPEKIGNAAPISEPDSEPAGGQEQADINLPATAVSSEFAAAVTGSLPRFDITI